MLRDPPEGLFMPYLEPIHAMDITAMIPRGNFLFGHPVGELDRSFKLIHFTLFSSACSYAYTYSHTFFKQLSPTRKRLEIASCSLAPESLGGGGTQFPS